MTSTPDICIMHSQILTSADLNASQQMLTNIFLPEVQWYGMT